MTGCPRSALTPRQDSVATNTCDSPRIAAVRNDGDGDGGSPRDCAEDALCCCYDTQLELERAAGPLCEDPVGPEPSDWRLLNCEETDFVDEYEDPDLPIIVRNQGLMGVLGGGGGQKTCGQRSFVPSRGLSFARASPGEFPWTCVVVDADDNEVAACAIVPRTFDNDIASGTDRVITVAHRVDRRRTYEKNF